jgi:hypothetical protein
MASRMDSMVCPCWQVHWRPMLRQISTNFVSLERVSAVTWNVWDSIESTHPSPWCSVSKCFRKPSTICLSVWRAFHNWRMWGAISSRGARVDCQWWSLKSSKRYAQVGLYWLGIPGMNQPVLILLRRNTKYLKRLVPKATEDKACLQQPRLQAREQ